MTIKKILYSMLALITFCTASVVVAQQKNPTSPALRAHMNVYVVSADEQGKARLLPAERVTPGQLLEYQVEYINQSSNVIRQVEATLPLPANKVVYQIDSAQPAQVLASVDGKNFSAPPLKRTVVLPGGQREIRPVPIAEYRYLRWSLGELNAGQKITVRARARVMDGAASDTVSAVAASQAKSTLAKAQ